MIILKKILWILFPFLNNNWNFLRLVRKSNQAYLRGNKLYASYLYYKISKRYNCFISPSVKMGRNVTFPHPTGIVIGSDVEIGDNVIIYQHVTLGRRNIEKAEYPKIGNNVIIYAGAVVTGNTTISDNCIVAANAVVTKDVVTNSIVGGVPAKIIKRNGQSE